MSSQSRFVQPRPVAGGSFRHAWWGGVSGLPGLALVLAGCQAASPAGTGDLTGNGMPPPEDAIVLFGGADDVRQWTQVSGAPFAWGVAGDEMVVIPGSGSVRTRETFGDFTLHVEFEVPELPVWVRGQDRGNSGVYIQKRYEVQILDSWGLDPDPRRCGAIYGLKAPDRNVVRLPNEWQWYLIEFTAPRFDAGGRKIRNARLSVTQNGVVIHDDVEVPAKTGMGDPEGPEPGPIVLQDHGSDVRFRNVWIVPR